MDLSGLNWLDDHMLSGPIERLLGTGDVQIVDWHVRKLVAGMGEGLGVWRLSGTATSDATTRAWSLVVKGWAFDGSDKDPSGWDWPHRELFAYRSRLLSALPGGITAPRHFGEIQRPDGTMWLWLEDAAIEAAKPWPLEWYARAAQTLGRFNGAYLNGHPLPEYPWLSTDWLSQKVESCGPSMNLLIASRDQQQLRLLVPNHTVEIRARLWDERHAWLASLDALPKTFCHLDAFSRNLFFRQGTGDGEDLVAIDWAFCGRGALGEELAALVVASVGFFDVPIRNARRLEEAAISGYVTGLREFGWDGDTALVWRGYATAAVLRYGLGVSTFMVDTLLEVRGHPRLERAMGRPIHEILDHFAAINTWIDELWRELSTGRKHS